MLLCSVATSGEDRHEELQQQEQAMAAFMDSFAANRAARLAELEGMQMAGSSRQLLSGRASASDMPTLPFEESQAWRTALLQPATPQSRSTFHGSALHNAADCVVVVAFCNEVAHTLCYQCRHAGFQFLLFH